MDKKEIKKFLQKVWYFIWESNSIWSWIVNIILAFVIIKFLVYPGLGLVLGTSHPIVAVVSGSMEHRITPVCTEFKEQKFLFTEYKRCLNYNYSLCGNIYPRKQRVDYNFYWNECGNWYSSNVNITKAEFEKFIFRNGFNKGDIIVLKGKPPEKINVGDVIVFRNKRPDPIIHRVVKKWKFNGKYYFQTKGDHNSDSTKTNILDEKNISQDDVIGRASLRIPYLGWIKIAFVGFLRLIGIVR